MSTQPAATRIADIPDDQLTAEQRAGLDALVRGRGKVLMPYKVWVYSPELMAAMEQLGTFLNKRCSLSEREVELGICLIAHHWTSPYVFGVHAKRCIELGYPSAVVDAIRDNQPVVLPNHREQAVCQVAALAQQPGPGSDQDFDHVIGVLGRNGLAEVLCLFGYYSAVALAMKLHRVPAP